MTGRGYLGFLVMLCFALTLLGVLVAVGAHMGWLSKKGSDASPGRPDPNSPQAKTRSAIMGFWAGSCSDEGEIAAMAAVRFIAQESGVPPDQSIGAAIAAVFNAKFGTPEEKQDAQITLETGRALLHSSPALYDKYLSMAEEMETPFRRPGRPDPREAE